MTQLSWKPCLWAGLVVAAAQSGAPAAEERNVPLSTPNAIRVEACRSNDDPLS